MCTIGSRFRTSGGNVVFKQCDLMDKNRFLEPKIEVNGDIQYIPFKRNKILGDGTEVEAKGAWAGVNNYGVSFVGADSYVQRAYDVEVSADAVDKLFEQYTKLVKDYKDAKSAADAMVEFYKTEFLATDIVLIADEKGMYFIEAFGESTICVERYEGYLSCTNHMRQLPGAVRYEDNHSTYLRLQRAEAYMEKYDDPLKMVIPLLKDQYYGKSVCSICRETDIKPIQEDPYYTQASVAFYITEDKKINCIYQLNGNPRDNDFVGYLDIFGENKEMKSIEEFN